MQALRLYAGPLARRHIELHGLRPQDVGAIPAAAGGPKGLILGPLDRFIFGEWLTRSEQPVHLLGASIGAWRMATACLNDSATALQRLERDYIAQHFELPPGQKRVTAAQVSGQFRHNLQLFYGGRVHEVLNHPRYRLHVIASRGRGLLARDGRWRTPLGYAGAFAANAWSRRALAGLLDRVVFSSAQDSRATDLPHLPFDAHDFHTHQARLNESNFMDALQASCSIPFVLRPVQDIAGAPRGAYWDGGITDYHLHLDYAALGDGIVLYPHFQSRVVPGWLDKPWKRRHRASRCLDNVVVVAPHPEWVRTLPGAKLPDRGDFKAYADDAAGRERAWRRALAESARLAEDFERLTRAGSVDALPLS